MAATVVAGCGKNKDDIPPGWELMEKNQSMSVYAEINSRRPMEYSPGKVLMNALFDHKKQMTATNAHSKDFAYLSSLEQIEYDCDESMMRTWHISYHEASMGQGSWDYFDLKETGNPSAGWIPVVTDLNNVQYKLKAFACLERARN